MSFSLAVTLGVGLLQIIEPVGAPECMSYIDPISSNPDGTIVDSWLVRSMRSLICRSAPHHHSMILPEQSPAKLHSKALLSLPLLLQPVCCLPNTITLHLTNLYTDTSLIPIHTNLASSGL